MNNGFRNEQRTKEEKPAKIGHLKHITADDRRLVLFIDAWFTLYIIQIYFKRDDNNNNNNKLDTFFAHKLF